MGEPFKSTLTGKIHTPIWEQDDLWWIVTSDSKYGYLGNLDPWRTYAMATKAAPAKTVNADGWKIGDRISFGQRSINLTILAVTEKSALLQADSMTSPYPETNDSLGKHYRRETAKVSLF